MAVLRDRPYHQFNFLVDLGTGETDGPDAGFEQIIGIGETLSVVEYRNGNHKENEVQKLPGLAKASDVTFKRGIIGSLTLYRWFDQVRNGDAVAYRTVSISLVSEDHTTVAVQWRLLRAVPVKYVCGPLNAKGTDVAIEELVLAYERLQME